MDQPVSLSPRQRYQRDLAQTGFVEDAAQARAVDALEQVYTALVDNPPRRFKRGWPAVEGLYLWGGVGRGKTYLMDRFYESLPFSRKQRTHFHRFMADVHERRRAYAGKSDPLKPIARELAHYRVLCFDEFYVSDVADAMILERLTRYLFDRGVTLVCTSNTPPAELYPGGLQRARFLPAIRRIEQHCRVLEVDGGKDHRLRLLESAEIYHHPLDETAERQLDHYFRQIVQNDPDSDEAVTIQQRRIPTRRVARDVAWFDFDALCASARSASDYTELARCFHTVLLSNVPVMDRDRDDEARRFVNLIDEFYDHGVKLIISAQAEPAELYRGKRLAFEFRRTISRLKEMGSRAYLASAHQV